MNYIKNVIIGFLLILTVWMGVKIYCKANPEIDFGIVTSIKDNKITVTGEGSSKQITFKSKDTKCYLGSAWQGICTDYVPQELTDLIDEVEKVKINDCINWRKVDGEYVQNGLGTWVNYPVAFELIQKSENPYGTPVGFIFKISNDYSYAIAHNKLNVLHKAGSVEDAKRGLLALVAKSRDYRFCKPNEILK